MIGFSGKTETLGFELIKLDDPAQIEFSFAAKRDALGPYVKERWGRWDDEEQRQSHRVNLGIGETYIISSEGKAVGTIALRQAEADLHLDGFYIVPNYQGRGLGSAVLERLLAYARSAGTSVLLRHFKWNPVGGLYRRHGFQVEGESENHYWLRWSPPSRACP